MAANRVGTLLAVGVALAALPPAWACVHVPRTYKGTVTEKTKEALLFHDGVNAHLIIRTNLQASSGALPDTMAWVIPLSSLPFHYEEADPHLFPEMFQAVEKANEARVREAAARGPVPSSSGAMPKSILVHPMQTVGSYRVQPIEVVDPKNAGGELNHWLLANGFGAVSAEIQRPYLKRGAVFLALTLHGLNSGFSDIKPLHIVYKADTLSLPLKFSANSGTFDVELYTFTPGPLDGALLGGDHLYADPSVKVDEAAVAPLLWQATGSKAGYLTRFEGWNFNIPQRSVRSLASDPTIDLRKDNSPPLLSSPESGFDGLTGWRGLAAVVILAIGFEFWRRKRGARQASD